MPEISKRAFVFDEWKKLAETNPEAFEFTRRRMIDSVIAKARAADRLKRLQWRIDMERERASTPMSACIRLSNMMLDSLYRRGGLARVLQDAPAERASAEIISLKKRRD